MLYGTLFGEGVWECSRTVQVFLEMLYNKPLEHFWNCSETFFKIIKYNSGTLIELLMGQMLERYSTIVLEKN